ncbi:MAG: hypothetical protein U0176_18275 [Bacteroidia bacterium]
MHRWERWRRRIVGINSGGKGTFQARYTDNKRYPPSYWHVQCALHDKAGNLWLEDGLDCRM